jgi:hypothetical protein
MFSIIHHTNKQYVELSTTQEANNCIVTRDFPSIIWTEQVHYRIHKSSPIFLILNQYNP